MLFIYRTCWSGNEWNKGNDTMGNKKGRHIFYLWRDLECLNKLNIIREVFNLLGSSNANSSSLIPINGGKKILNIGNWLNNFLWLHLFIFFYTHYCNTISLLIYSLLQHFVIRNSPINLANIFLLRSVPT